MRFKITKDTISVFLEKYPDKLDDNLKKVLSDTGDFMVREIRSNWSPEKPSKKGNPPAIDTGALDASIFSKDENIDKSANKKGLVWYVYTNTSPINNKEYAAALEDEDYKFKRFFMRPTYEIVHKMMLLYLKEYFSKIGKVI